METLTLIEIRNFTILIFIKVLFGALDIMILIILAIRYGALDFTILITQETLTLATIFILPDSTDLTIVIHHTTTPTILFTAKGEATTLDIHPLIRREAQTPVEEVTL